jgi:hypothetical protein
MFTDVKVRVFNIDWDADDLSDIVKEISLTIPRSCFDDVNERDSIIDCVEEYIEDEISNMSGFCHKGFNYKIESDIPFFITNYGTEENIEIFQDYSEAKRESANGEVFKAKLNSNNVWFEEDLGWNYDDSSDLFIDEPFKIIEKV